MDARTEPAPLPVTLEAIRRAAARSVGVVRRTPSLEAPALSHRCGAQVVVKADSLQVGGSFKFRGAFNQVACLAPERRARGLIAGSSGNYGQALALAARAFGVPATLVMPSDAPATKVAGVLAAGAELLRYDRYAEVRDAVVAAAADERDALRLNGYDDWDLIAGHGSAGLELAEDAGEFDVVIAPVGGGGLLAGCALALAELQPGCILVGVEPESGDDARQSLAAGRRVQIPVPATIADGLQLTSPGERPFAVIQRYIDQIVTVSDQQLINAMAAVFDDLRLVLEPSGAAAVAAILSGALDVKGARVAVLASGGNIDRALFSSMMGEAA